MFLDAVRGLAEEAGLDVADPTDADLAAGTRVLVPRGDEVGEGGAEHADGQAHTFCDVLQPVLPVLGGLGGDDVEGLEGGVRRGQVGEAFVDQFTPQRRRVVEGRGQDVTASVGEEVGGVGAVWQGGEAREWP